MTRGVIRAQNFFEDSVGCVCLAQFGERNASMVLTGNIGDCCPAPGAQGGRKMRASLEMCQRLLRVASRQSPLTQHQVRQGILIGNQPFQPFPGIKTARSQQFQRFFRLLQVIVQRGPFQI